MYNKLIVLVIIVVVLFSGCDKGNTQIEEQQIESDNVVSQEEIETNESMDDNIIINTIEDEGSSAQEINIDEEQVFLETIKTVRVSATTLNVRDNSSTDSEVIATLLLNEVIDVFDEVVGEDGEVWYKVQLEPELFGWIASWYTIDIDDSYFASLEFEIVDPQTITDAIVDDLYYEVDMSVNKKNFIISYDLDSNGVEEKIIISPTKEGEAMIIMDEEVSLIGFEYDRVMSFGLIDIDVSDGYIDLYTLSNYGVAPHAKYKFLRLESGSLKEVGDLNSLIMHVDGSGKLYFWGGQIFETTKEKFNYDMVMTYYDISKNELVEVNAAVGKTFECEYRSVIVFSSLEYIYDDVWEQVDWNKEEHEGEYIAELTIGDKFTVLEDLGARGTYLVQLEDGQTGYVSGFHFYID